MYDASKKVWFFPAMLFLIVLVLSSLQINGSSIGIYHQLLYGDSSRDPNLLLNEPRSVRSDEWLVTTQLALGQDKTDFAPVNKNIGEGIDVSLLVDAPSSDVMQVFKPHNFGFFVLPAGVAFALKWWLLAYFLVVSVYMFTLALLPKRKLLAVLLSLSFLASPFIMWWYQYITIAPLYYTLFGIVVFIKMVHARSIKTASLWGLLLAYISTSFALVLYPPFQVPCALFAVAFLVGYLLDNRKKLRGAWRSTVLGFGVAGAVTILLTTVCLLPKILVIETITHTAYPGNRLTESGGFNPLLFFASNTSLLSQSDLRAGAFSWLPNQSEGSNFLLVFILLMPLLLFLVAKYRHKLPNFWTILALLVLTMVFMVWIFVPDVDFLGKITLLNRVLHARLLIGFGLINLLAIILLIQTLERRDIKLPRYLPEIYSLTILVAYAVLNIYITKHFPVFMGYRWALVLSLPYAFIIYLALKKRFNFAALALMVFSIGSVVFIHPLYRGVDILVNSETSTLIRGVDQGNSKRWVTDSLQLENYPILNGKQSLSGVYVYPDIDLWSKAFPANDSTKYNRYSHVHFEFDRNANEFVQRKLNQPSPDQLMPIMEPCDEFLKANNVGYILTTQEFTSDQAHCAKMIRHVSLPRANVYIYELNF